jgi:hypothetical protein
MYNENNRSAKLPTTFTISIHPYFHSIEADIKKYESIVFGPNGPEMDTYLETFSRDQVFGNLAWYNLMVGMSFRIPVLSHGLAKMVEAFTMK